MIRNDSNCAKLSKTFTRWAFILAGLFFLGLGIIGIFLPLLPTTPFLLLAAACFARGSKKFYNGLLNSRFFGAYIKNYREGRGIPLKVKIASISLLWITIALSILLLDDLHFIKFILILIATGVTIHITSIRTLKKSNQQ